MKIGQNKKKIDINILEEHSIKILIKSLQTTFNNTLQNNIHIRHSGVGLYSQKSIRLFEEHCNFKASLGNLVRPVIKVNNKRCWGCGSFVPCSWFETLVTYKKKKKIHKSWFWSRMIQYMQINKTNTSHIESRAKLHDLLRSGRKSLWQIQWPSRQSPERLEIGEFYYNKDEVYQIQSQ